MIKNTESRYMLLKRKLEGNKSMNNYNIISMDFDGTLLTSNKKITDRTRKVLLNFKNNGYLIVGITARNLLSVKSVLDVNMFNFIILNNGSNIYDVEKEKIINIAYIKDETVRKIFDYFGEDATQIDCCTSSRYYIKTNEKYDSKDFLVYIDNINEVNEPISRMNLFFKTEEELLKYREIIENEFCSVNVVSMRDTDSKNSRKWLTINPNNVNKFNTLKIICDKVESTTDNTIFFGDGENDLTLIENVGLGIAMENAIEIVKNKASRVTLSNDEEGLAIFLEESFND